MVGSRTLCGAIVKVLMGVSWDLEKIGMDAIALRRRDRDGVLKPRQRCLFTSGLSNFSRNSFKRKVMTKYFFLDNFAYLVF